MPFLPSGIQKKTILLWIQKHKIKLLSSITISFGLFSVILFFVFASTHDPLAQAKLHESDHISRNPVTPTPSLSSTPTPTVHITQTPTPTTVQTLSTKSKLLIGMGPEADQAISSRLVQESNVNMLTSWYNKPEDLSWMTGWKGTLVPELYAKGYTLHLVTFTDYPETDFETPYGPTCGREYPLSGRFLDDMKQLAETFAGSGKLYVTLFTEFQTYPCEDNAWNGSENYYKTLKDQYRSARQVFKQHAPNAQVALSWGGWQHRWDDPGVSGGRSLFPHFADVMRESDFTAFQAMQDDTNIDDIRQMTQILARYKTPVMLSHYKPDHSTQSTFENDMNGFFTDAFIEEITAKGLFAFSFMDTQNLSNSEDIYQHVKTSVSTYGSN